MVRYPQFTASHVARWIAIFILALFVAVPLTTSGRFAYPAGPIKVHLFQSAVEVAFFLWCVVALVDKRFRPRFTLLSAALFISLTVLTVSSAGGVDVRQSFWGPIDMGYGLVLLWHGFALFLILSSVRGVSFRHFALVNAGTGALVGIVAIAQWLSWQLPLSESPTIDRAYGTFSNAPHLAAYLIFTIFINFWLSRTEVSLPLRRLAGAATAVNIIALFLTKTRGAIIGLTVGLIAIAFLAWWKRPRHKMLPSRAYLLTPAIAVVFGIAILVAVLVPNTPLVHSLPGLDRFASASLKENLFQRMVGWDTSFRAALERPLLGYGWNTAGFTFFRNYDPSRYLEVHHYAVNTGEKTLNVLLDYFISGGVLGLLSYLGVLGAALYALRRSSLPETPILLGMGVAYFVQNLVLYDSIATYPLFFGILAFIDRGARHEENTPLASDRSEKRTVLTPFLFLALALAAIPIVTIHWRALQVLAAHQKALAERDSVQSLSWWRNAAERWSPYRDQLRLEYAQELKGVFGRGSTHTDWIFLHQEAIAHLESVLAKRKQDSSVMTVTAQAYLAFRSFDPSYVTRAFSLLAQAKQLAPSDIRITISYAKALLILQKREEAEEALGEAFRRQPGLSDLHVMLSILFHQLGDDSASFKEMEDASARGILPRYTEELMLWGDSYADRGKCIEAVTLYEKALNAPAIRNIQRIYTLAQIKFDLISTMRHRNLGCSPALATQILKSAVEIRALRAAAGDAMKNIPILLYP